LGAIVANGGGKILSHASRGLNNVHVKKIID